MNNNYDFNSKKYFVLLAIVLIIFIIFIVKAFDYLPEQISNDGNVKETIVNNINSPAQIKTSNELRKDESDTFDNNDEKHKHGHFDFMPKEDDEVEIEDFPAPKGTNEEKIQTEENNDTKTSSNMSSEERALKCIINAQKYKANSDYSNALNEYQKVEDLTDNRELRAMSYEGIAELYAQNRKFGTALAFANKAQNISPTTAREMLIARIYYLSGNTDVAVTRLNSLLKQGF